MNIQPVNFTSFRAETSNNELKKNEMAQVPVVSNDHITPENESKSTDWIMWGIGALGIAGIIYGIVKNRKSSDAKSEIDDLKNKLKDQADKLKNETDAKNKLQEELNNFKDFSKKKIEKIKKTARERSCKIKSVFTKKFTQMKNFCSKIINRNKKQ